MNDDIANDSEFSDSVSSGGSDWVISIALAAKLSGVFDCITLWYSGWPPPLDTLELTVSTVNTEYCWLSLAWVEFTIECIVVSYVRLSPAYNCDELIDGFVPCIWFPWNLTDAPTIEPEKNGSEVVIRGNAASAIASFTDPWKYAGSVSTKLKYDADIIDPETLPPPV